MYKYSVLLLANILCSTTLFATSIEESPNAPGMPMTQEDGHKLSTDYVAAISLPAQELNAIKKNPEGLSTKPFRNFFTPTYLVDSDKINHGTIIKSQNGRMLMTEGSIVYADSTQGMPHKFVAGDYMILSRPQKLEHHEAQSSYIVHPSGTAKLVGNHKSIAILKIINVQSEIMSGDWLIPLQEINTQLPKTMHYMETPVSGEVIASTQDQMQTGESHSVALNIGRNQNVKLGTLLYLKTEPTKSVDPNTKKTIELPGHLIGRAVIYRVSSSMSIALILDSQEEITNGIIASTHEYE